jgi:hypothetical protein
MYARFANQILSSELENPARNCQVPIDICLGFDTFAHLTEKPDSVGFTIQKTQNRFQQLRHFFGQNYGDSTLFFEKLNHPNIA